MFRFLWLILITTGSLSLKAQTPLTLPDAIRIGLQESYQIDIAEQRIDIAERNDNYKTAGAYPTVDFIFNVPSNYAIQNNPNSFIQGAFVTTGANAAVQANWVMFDGYRVRYTKRRLETLVQQTRQSLQLQVEATTVNIMLAYYNALIAREQLEVLQDVIDLSRDRIAYQELRREYGQSNTFVVLQTREAYIADSITLMQQQVAYSNSILNLQLAMGVVSSEVEYIPTDSLAADFEQYAYETLEQRLLADNNNLQNLLLNRELATVNVDLRRATLYPTISAGASAEYGITVARLFADNPNTGEPFETAVGDNIGVGLGFTLAYPLYDAGQRRRNIENARVEALIAQLDIDDLKRTLRAQLATTLATYDNQRRLLQLAQARVSLLEEQLAVAEERLRGGIINTFDYRQIQVNYVNAQQVRLNIIFQLKTTETELVRLTGGITR